MGLLRAFADFWEQEEAKRRNRIEDLITQIIRLKAIDAHGDPKLQIEVSRAIAEVYKVLGM